MSRSSIAAVAFAPGFCVVGVSGCSTMQIAMNPKVPTDIPCRLPFAVGLYLAPEFEVYHWRGPATAQLCTLDYDFGSASKVLFLQTFTHLAREIQLVDRRPPYHGPDEPTAAIVIEPHLIGFGEGHSASLRIAAYTAHGAKTYSPDSSYDAVAGIAMTRAIAELVNDVRQLPVTP